MGPDLVTMPKPLLLLLLLMLPLIIMMILHNGNVYIYTSEFLACDA